MPPAPSPSARAPSRLARITQEAQTILPGAIVAGLAFVVADRLGLITLLGVRRLSELDDSWLLWLAVFGGALLARTRARRVPFAVAGLVLGLYVVVGHTPLFVPSIRSWILAEPPAHADAIVVLSSDVTEDGHVSANGLTRYVAALELARAGWAPLLVRTAVAPPRPDDRADAQRIAGDLGVEIATVGPVASTRDEAVAFAALAEARGIERVIVVTQPLHERRAAATFRALGLDVIACPSPERAYSLPQLVTPTDRVRAFELWVTELGAWTLYGVRGWLDEPMEGERS